MNKIVLFVIALTFSGLNLLAADDYNETKYKTVQLGDEIKMVCNNLNDIAKVQWFKDGVELTEQKSDKLIFKNAMLSHEGTYWAVVDGVCGITKTNDMIVQVELPFQSGIETAVAGGDFLFQNEPNPAGEIIRIKFNLSKTSNTKLALYDSFGKQIALVFEGELSSGFHSYEINSNNLNLANGAYFYTLITPDFIDTKSMILLK